MIIFKENEAKIQPKSIVYFIRKILNLLHETNSQSLLFFGRNQSMNQFLTYFQTNITVMNEYQFVEILVLIRRFKDLNLDFGGKVDSLIKKIIPLLENYKSLNLKLAAQIFHEYSLLNIDTKNIFMFINKMLNDSSQQPYFTGYAISIIIKACSHNYVKTKKNFYASFCYKLLNMLEKHLKHFKLGALCRLFKNICVLQLNIYTPHQRLHSVIIQIKGIIQEQKADLQEKDLLCLLEAFIHAPVSFDNSLLLYLKSTTLHTMQETPKTLTLKFLIRFVDLMGQQFKEIRLKEESLDRIGREILKRLQYSENIKFSLMFDCIKAFAQKNFYYHKNLFHFLYKKIITTPENEININLTVFMIKILIPIKFDCRELLFILKTKVVKQDFVIHIDKLLDLMYIYSYPLNSKTSEFVTFCTDALNAIKKQLDAKKLEITNSFLFILAREYCYVSNPYFIELHTMALTILKNEWDKLRPIRRLDLALSFINVKVKKQEWHLFLNEKIMNLDEENLKLLLNTYCLKEAKDYSSFDLVLKALLTSPQENLKKQLKNIIEAFIRTPPFKIINLKGNPNHKIFQLIELIDWNIEIQEFKISYTEVLKFVRFFNALDMNTDFLLPIFLHPWKKGTLIQSFQAGDLGLIEIGAFITESVLLSSNYYKIRKNIKISNNLSSEKKLQNNDINLGNKEDFTIISTEKPIETLKNSENLTLELDNNKEGSENMEVNTIISFDKSLENMDSRTKGNNIGDILNISQEIFNNLKSYFEIGLKTKKYDISLSWISKFLRIYIFLFEYQPNFDKVLLPIIFQQIKNKLDKRIIDNRPTIVKTMFLLIELDLLKAEFTLEQREYIRQNLEVRLELFLFF